MKQSQSHMTTHASALTKKCYHKDTLTKTDWKTKQCISLTKLQQTLWASPNWYLPHFCCFANPQSAVKLWKYHSISTWCQIHEINACIYLQSAVRKTILSSLLLVWEPTFQGILLSPHNVNQRVLQRVHAETIKGPCSLLLKERKTTISVLTSHIAV